MKRKKGGEPDLTEKQLELSVKDAYSHQSLDTKTDAERLSIAKEQAFQKKKEANERKDAELQAKEEEEEAKQAGEESDVDAEKEEGEEGEEEMHDPDEQEYEVFYDQDQIKNTFFNQQKDVFSDIRFERFDLFNQSDGLAGLKSKNKFMIEDFAPKLPKQEGEVRQKKKGGGPQLPDEDEMEREAARLREEEQKEKEKQEKIRQAAIEKNAHKLQENQVENEIKEMMENLNKI